MAIYTYQYYLKKDASTYYKVENGNVVETLIKTPLKHSVQDWEKTVISFKRDTLYMGVFLEITPPIRFVLDAAKILRSIYFDITQGVEGECILHVEILNPSSMLYENFYDGNIDFSQVSDERDFFQATIANRGLQESITSRQDIEYPIDLNAPEAEIMNIDGMYVNNKASWYPGNYSENTSNVLTSDLSFGTTDNAIGGRSVNLSSGDVVDQIFPFIRAHQQGGFVGNAIALIDQVYNAGTPTPTDGQYLFYTNTEIKNVVFDAKMKATIHMPNVAGTKHVRVRALVVDRTLPSPSIVSSNLLFDYTTTATNADVSILFNINSTIATIPANCYLVVVMTGQKPSGTAADENAFFPIEDGYFNITFQAKVSPTDTKCLRYYHAMNQLVSKISDGTASLVSSTLNTDNSDSTSRFKNWDTAPYYEYLTNGKAIRGLKDPITGLANPMQLTFKDAFADLFATKGQALMIENENTLRVEPLRYVFDNSLSATISKTNNIIIHNYDKIFNSVQGGYDYDETNNTTNGQNAFNTILNYSCDKGNRTPLQQVNLSPFIADPTVIERIRGDNLDSTQSGDTNDNNVFAIEASPVLVGGKRVVYRPLGVVSGINDTVNAYNVAKSSGRCNRVLLPFHRSIKPNGNLIFQTSTQTNNLVSTFGSGTVIEKDNLPLDNDVYNGHDVSRYFLPWMVEFDCEDIFLYNQIRNNPRGYIQFDYYGKMQKGYIWNFDFTPETGEGKGLLAFHPQTDLSTLKR